MKKMKIGYLGIGAWGYCLASLLASKSHHQLICWTTKRDLALQLEKTREHPLLPGHPAPKNMYFTTNMSEALQNVDMIVESVTSAGIRPVFEQVRSLSLPFCPIVITSKGIEQDTEEILPEVAVEVLGVNYKEHIGVLSGPSFAQEVIKHLPTSIVASGYSKEVTKSICDTFATPTFRVYPNEDILGVAFGGALKNPIAIACGISDGLGLGHSAKAALITRGLHEIRKLSVARGCLPETINGLAGMGDLCLTCTSALSRNYRFGMMLSQGLSSEEARNKIGMVVEGAYTSVSAIQLGQHYNIDLPIIETVNRIILGEIRPGDAVGELMKRPVKQEYL